MGRTTTTLEFATVTRSQVDGVIDHINADHADTVLLVARHLAPGALDAELSSIDPSGANFEVRDRSGAQAAVRLEFPSDAAEAHEVEVRLLDAMVAARSAADPSEPLTSLEAELAITAQLTTTHGRVAAVRPVTPNLIEVTLTGFVGYPLRGGDEFVFAMVSDAPGAIPPDYSMDQYRGQPEDGPVRGAYYTVRRSRPDMGEIDLWVVVHDHSGSVAAWLAAAEPGDPIALWGPRRGFEVQDAPACVLLVADETGLAATAALVEHTGAQVRFHAVLEVIDEAHQPELPVHPGLTVEWVHRGGSPPGTVDRLLDAVVASVRSTPDAAFGAAESRQITAVRRHLRSTLGMAATDVLMTGYWRRGE